MSLPRRAMRDRVSKTALATTDIRKLAKYYRTEAGLNVSLKFVDQAESAFKAISERPLLGALLGLTEPRYADIRRWQIKGFERLIIFYREAENGVEIVRVIDATRDFGTLFPV
jgi:toxin ParE1/3/4